MRKYFLFTGATGLLGSYLMRDCLFAGLPLAVLVRRSRVETARGRVESILARWERQIGREIPRPVVLEGDISQPDLGLGEEQIQWIAAHCDSVLHSAASLSFKLEEKTNEPWRSNLEGTRHVLALARRTGLRQIHYVSTAYICGQRTGRILESEVDVGQTPGNPYEDSKLQAEQLVRNADCFDQVTIYRPAIIVGDSRTGYTSTYHGFYTPLMVLHLMASKIPGQSLEIPRLLGSLNLTGNETKNFVPVDWVSAVMVHILTNPQHHGETYHLTPGTRSTVGDMTRAFERALTELTYPRVKAANGTTIDLAQFEQRFRDQMQMYSSYWRDDPEFDQTNTTRAAPHLPCPELDSEVLWTLSKYAVEHNFGWPLPAPIPADFDVARHLAQTIAEPRFGDQCNGSVAWIGLAVNGPGGGQWSLAVQGQRAIAVGEGLRPDVVANVQLDAKTFGQLADGTCSAADAQRSGRLLATGAALPTTALLAAIQQAAGGEAAQPAAVAASPTARSIV